MYIPVLCLSILLVLFQDLLQVENKGLKLELTEAATSSDLLQGVAQEEITALSAKAAEAAEFQLKLAETCCNLQAAEGALEEVLCFDPTHLSVRLFDWCAATANTSNSCIRGQSRGTRSFIECHTSTGRQVD